MPTPRMTMSKIREILRLQGLALSQRQIARAALVSLGAVCQTLRHAKASGRTVPELLALDDAALATALAPRAQAAPASRYMIPDTATIHEELKRKGMTLQLLWEEYREAYGPRAYGYTQFCAHYREFRTRLKTSLRQTHVAGEKCFTDYAGPTIGVVCARTGEIRKAQIFVGVLGASSYTYCEATWTQGQRDWVGSHARMLSFFQGVRNRSVLLTRGGTTVRRPPDLRVPGPGLCLHHKHHPRELGGQAYRGVPKSSGCRTPGIGQVPSPKP